MNSSFTSISSVPSEREHSSQIPVFINTRSENVKSERLPAVRKTLPRHKAVDAHLLPSLTIYNARSLFPKLSSFITDMAERATAICCVSEIWEV